MSASVQLFDLPLSPSEAAPHSVLRDPLSGKPLKQGNNSLRAEGSPHRYPVFQAPHPTYDLFVHDPARPSPLRGRASWDVEAFDSHYADVGYYEDGEDYEARTGQDPSLTEFHHRRVKDVLLQWITPGPDQTIMDVGCGAGWFLERIWSRYHQDGHRPRVVGLEASRLQARFTAERMAKAKLNEGFVVRANAEHLPFEDHSFDVVTCSEALEQIADPSRAIQEMARVLKPEGRLLLSAPSRLGEIMWDTALSPAVGAFKAARRLLKRGAQEEAPFGEYYAALYPEELESALSNAGLVVHCMVQNGLIPHNHYFRQLPQRVVPGLVRMFDEADQRFSHLLPNWNSHVLFWAEKPL